MNYNNLAKVLKKGLQDLKYFIPTKKIPENLIWFLTERCSLKCSHCFVSHKGRIYRDELSCEETIKIFKSGENYLKKISFTGGEPMLYKNFEKIFFEASNLKKIQQLHLSTNGMHNQKLFDTLSEIKNNKISIQIQSSLDGLEETHNQIRGNKRSFSNVFDLFDGLKKFSNLNLEYNIVMTCSKDNLKEVEKAIENFSDIEIPITINFVRSSDDAISDDKNDFKPINDVALSLDETKYVINLWKKNFKSKLDKYTYVLNLVKMKNMLLFLKKKKWLYDCSAGLSDAVILSDGSVAICETRKPIGNLKDYNFSYTDFWSKNYQKDLKKCYCNYDCAAIYSINKSIKGQLTYLKEFLSN